MIKNILLITILLLISSCSNYKSVFSNKVNGETQKPVLVLEDTSKDVLLSKIINPQNLDNVNVNGYLWRATLNILSLAPLISTDALSGIIITDWYSNNQETSESIKVTIRFLSNEIRSDAIDIKVFYKDCKVDMSCKIFERDGVLKNELRKEILKQATIYQKQSKDKDFKKYNASEIKR